MPRRSDKRVYRIRKCRKCKRRFRTFEQLDPKQHALIGEVRTSAPARRANHPGAPRKDGTVTLAELPDDQADEPNETDSQAGEEWKVELKDRLPDLKV